MTAPTKGGPAASWAQAKAHQTSRVCGRQDSQATSICAVVAATLAACELDKLNALQLPTPALLAERLRARATDFFLLVGVVATFLKVQGVDRG